MSLFLVSALLSGCASRPTVSQDQLVDVPPEVVEQVRVMRAEERRLADQISAAEARLEQARQRESDEQARLEANRDALRETERLKRLAVQRADPDAATRTDEQAAERQRLIEQIQNAHESAVAERERADAALAVLRAQRDVQDAQIELVQARAVSADNIDRFERAVVEAQGNLDSAKRQQAYIESTHEGTAMPNGQRPDDSGPDMEYPEQQSPDMEPQSPTPETEPPPPPEEERPEMDEPPQDAP